MFLTAQTLVGWEAKCVCAFWLGLVCYRSRCSEHFPGLNLCPAWRRCHDQGGWSWEESPPGKDNMKNVFIFMPLFTFQHLNQLICHAAITFMEYLVVTLSRAMALSSFLSSSSLMYMSYSSWRCGGTGRLWSGAHKHTSFRKAEGIYT